MSEPDCTILKNPDRLAGSRRGGKGAGPVAGMQGRARGTGNRSPRLLLVDDDPKLLEVMGNNLRHLGCTVDSAAGGEEALALLERGSYVLALVDVVMPGIDGLSLAARMRQCWPDMRVVVFSGQAETEMVTQAFRLGIDDFLCKPIDGEQLRNLLQRFAWPSEPIRVKPGPLDEARAAGERAGILAALEAAGWNCRAAAEILRVSYSTLMRRMKRLGIRERGS